MRTYVLGAVVLILLVASAALAFRRPPAVRQPIAFPHKTHIANQMECLTCHSNADRSIMATFPSVSDCMVCHENIKTDSPEIKKLAAYAARNEEPPWVRVYTFEDEADVYFSHKRHVKANVDCSRCHGDQQNAMDARQRVQWTMGKCIDCHREHKVSVDCLTCHK
jgi:Cytochrome c7 and related cytochrome c